MERYIEAYREEMKSFVNTVAKNKDVEVSADDALAATKIALACQESIRTKLPVYL